MRRTTLGYLVIWDGGQGIRDPLGLIHDEQMPAAGLLCWGGPPFMYSTRAAARAAIDRTHHYAKAFGDDDMPARPCCKVEPVHGERQTDG